jgi:hypothetical protein
MDGHCRWITRSLRQWYSKFAQEEGDKRFLWPSSRYIYIFLCYEWKLVDSHTITAFCNTVKWPQKRSIAPFQCIRILEGAGSLKFRRFCKIFYSLAVLLRTRGSDSRLWVQIQRTFVSTLMMVAGTVSEILNCNTIAFSSYMYLEKRRVGQHMENLSTADLILEKKLQSLLFFCSSQW